MSNFFGPNGGGGSGGGGGISVSWLQDENAPTRSFRDGVQTYSFGAGLGQKLFGLMYVPSTYSAGGPISLRMTAFTASTANSFLMQTVATLVDVSAGDPITTTTNQRTSTNSAVAVSGSTVNDPLALVFDLTDTTGRINSVAVAGGDLIKIQISRVADTVTGDVELLADAYEVTIA